MDQPFLTKTLVIAHFHPILGIPIVKNNYSLTVGFKHWIWTFVSMISGLLASLFLTLLRNPLV